MSEMQFKVLDFNRFSALFVRFDRHLYDQLATVHKTIMTFIPASVTKLFNTASLTFPSYGFLYHSSSPANPKGVFHPKKLP
jgi:hypothetical protein